MSDLYKNCVWLGNINIGLDRHLCVQADIRFRAKNVAVLGLIRFFSSQRCVFCNLEGNCRNFMEDCISLGVRFCWLVIFFHTVTQKTGNKSFLSLTLLRHCSLWLLCSLQNNLSHYIDFYGLLNTDLYISCFPAVFFFWDRVLLCILVWLSWVGLYLEDLLVSCSWMHHFAWLYRPLICSVIIYPNARKNKQTSYTFFLSLLQAVRTMFRKMSVKWKPVDKRIALNWYQYFHRLE